MELLNRWVNSDSWLPPKEIVGALYLGWAVLAGIGSVYIPEVSGPGDVLLAALTYPILAVFLGFFGALFFSPIIWFITEKGKRKFGIHGFAIAIGTFFLIALTFGAGSPAMDDSGGASDSGGGGETYVQLTEWENQDAETFDVVVQTYVEDGRGDAQVQDQVRWRASGDSEEGGLFAEFVNCNQDTDGVAVSIFTVDGESRNIGTFEGIPCKGGDHGFKVLITSGERLDFVQQF